MELLKKIFPYSFKEMKTVSDLVIGIIVYAVVGIIAGAIIAISGALTNWIPMGIGAVTGAILSAVGSIAEVYVGAGIVIKVLVYTKVIKE